MRYDKYTFFYGGSFSQWLRCDFTVDGVQYSCAEQYMMAMKAEVFGDEAAKKAIMKASHPREQKALGRKVKNFDPKKWSEVARDIVYKGNYAKFQQNKGLLHALNETEGTLLVEASPTDKIWGIGMKEGAAGIEDPKNWKGTNWLGEVITKVREDLRDGIYRTEDFNWK